MAESIYKADLLRQADVRLCRLCLWSNFEGLGIDLEPSGYPPYVLRTIESNSPAAASGLRVRDVILAVNHQDMSNKKFNRVRKAIAVARDANDYVELLVVEGKYYKVLKSQKIPIDSTSATVISAPVMMPADFATFSRLIPQMRDLRLNRNDTTFGFEAVNGENYIGVHVQQRFSDLPASGADLRISGPIIEINVQHVDRQSDTQNYEHYINKNMKFNLTYSSKATCWTTPQEIQSSQIDQKSVINDDEVSSKYDTIRPNHSNNLLLSPKNTLTNDKRQNDANTKLDDERYSSSSTLNQRNKDSIGRRRAQIFSSSKKRHIKHDSEDQPISDGESPDNDENYHDFRNDYPVSVDHDSRSISRFEDDDTKYNYPADVGYGSWNLPKFENNDTKQNDHCDSSSKKQSSTTSVTKAQSKDDYYHSNEDINTSDIKHASVRRYSLTDSRQPNQSTRSKPPVTNDVANISNGTIQIGRGDITEQMVDAIVVASTSDSLRENVLRQAGDSIRAIYDNEKQQKTKQSICTNSGNLACKRIYFIPCSQMSSNANKWTFRNFVSEAIKIATNDRSTTIQSIAFPAIGCGQYGCNSTFVAKTLIMAVAYELKKQPSLQLNVYFVIQQNQQTIFDVFRNELITLKNNESTYSQSSELLMHLPPKPPTDHKNKKEFVVEKRLLDSSSDEYTKVINEFSSTMTSQIYKEIVRVELVWNERWYKQYMIHKADFSERLQKDTEKHLFHGCSENAANSIIKDCFNRSYTGTHGVAYGHGVYFSSEASYSHSYATPNTKGERCMFLAKVLIGKTILGNSSMKICPVGYDTTTDGSHIFVIYHDAQAFGHYLITYK